MLPPSRCCPRVLAEVGPGACHISCKQIYGKPKSAGCLENDFTFAGETLQLSCSMIDGSIFDAQLMSCCNVREYLAPKKDIKEFKSINDTLDVLSSPGFGTGVYADEDNEEDIPRNAEMFEAASILSAMQILFFFTLFPCLCMSQTLCPFLCILYVCLSAWFCV